jgi:catechol 2,3-dioxygenase-like lactoylglutathione lyase family enzyme
MPIEIKGLAPLLQVFDMPTSLHFYRDVIGFRLVAQSQPERGDDCGWALLELNGSELMLNTLYEPDHRPPEPDVSRIAVHDDTRIYFGCPNVAAAYANLVDNGIEAKPPYMTGYGFHAIDLNDPDGYGLTFHWPADS